MTLPAPAGRASSRIVFLDLLRLVASVQMIQGHTIDGVLAAGLRHGAAFDAWVFARGLTATSFLVASGLAFHATVVAGPPAARSPEARARRLQRAATLVALGYLLHLPLGAILSPSAPGAAAAWAAFAICDVLQCIGLTLVALEVVVAVAPTPWPFAVALGALAYGAAPIAAGLHPAGPLRVLENLVARGGGSIFPLTPHAGHLCMGMALGALVLPAGATTPRRTTIPRLTIAGGAVLALAAAAFTVLPGRDPAYAPPWSLLKLGLVFLVAALLALGSARVERLPRFFETLAGETLLLYASHLLVVYGAGVGLSAQVGPTLPLGAALAVTIAVLGGSVAFAYAWRWGRARLARARAGS